MVFETTLGALVPVAFILVLGFLAGRHHAFDEDQSAGLNELALTFALPANLLISMAMIKRSSLLAEVPLLGVLVIILGGGYLVAYVLALKVAHRTKIEAALLALATTNCAIPVYGIAVLGGLFPKVGPVVVPLGALVINIAQVPVALALLESGGRADVTSSSSGNAAATGSSANSGNSSSTMTTSKGASTSGFSIVVSTLKKPLVWAPLIGIAYSLTGLSVPKVAEASLTLLGQATSGVAILAAGIILVANTPRFSRLVVLLLAIKALALPAAAFALTMLFGISGTLRQETVVAFALPTGVLVVQLSQRYKAFQQEAASMMFFTTILTFVLLPIVYILT